MKWFKHHENASSNKFIQALLMEKNGLELYAQWFLLLEFLCKEFKKDTTTFTASFTQLKTVFRVKQDEKLRKVMRVFHDFSESFDQNLLETSELSGNFYKIETPIISELIGKEFIRTRQSRAIAAAKKKNKKENKNKEIELVCTELEKPSLGAIEEFSHDGDLVKLLVKVNKSNQEAWIKAYQDTSWLIVEIHKARAWLEANPRKKPKGNPARFLGNWFSRGFEQYRKNLPSNNSNLITLDDLDLGA